MYLRNPDFFGTAMKFCSPDNKKKNIDLKLQGLKNYLLINYPLLNGHSKANQAAGNLSS